MNENWIELAASDAIDEGSAIEVVAEGQILAIFRYQGTLYALDGMCAHQGGPIAEGTVYAACRIIECIIECPVPN